MNRKQINLGISIRSLVYHPAAWRHPDVPDVPVPSTYISASCLLVHFSTQRTRVASAMPSAQY